MGTNAYTVWCDTPPADEHKRSEQMLLKRWYGGSDSRRYFTLAFRVRNLPASVPNGKRGYITQWHQGANGPPPIRAQWVVRDGKYYLDVIVRYDSGDTTACTKGSYTFYKPNGLQAEIAPGLWHRMLVAIDLGPTLGTTACPNCPGESGAVSVWLMNNESGVWESIGEPYAGRVGFAFQGDPVCEPTYRSDVDFQWKVGQYVQDVNHSTDYDNVAYGKRWNNITKNRLIGYQKSVLRLAFEEWSGATVYDRSWAWNGGQLGDVVTDYDNDGQIQGPVSRNADGISGRSLHFNGSNYVSVPMDPTDFDFGNYVTVSVWFRTTAHPTDNKGLVMIDEYSTLWKVLLYMSDTGLSFGVKHPGGSSPYSKLTYSFPAGTYADGEWHHVVGTFNRFAADNRRVKLYIDGARVKQIAGLDLPILRGTNRLTVGKFSVSGYFVGDLDEINVLNYTMTDEDVWSLWLERGAP